MKQLKVHEHTFENGLKAIGEVNPEAKSVAMGFFVRTGARDETSKEAGISHFLEHMMFKGTHKRSALEVTYDLGNMAAKSNAYTSEEGTTYYAVVLPEYFSALKELLSDMLRPSLDPKEFDVEKKVILEEIALYQDKPHYFLIEKMTADYFKGHPAGNSVLGTTASVSAISRDEMSDYFGRRYCGSNITVVATGNYDWDGFLKDIQKYCGGWPTGNAPRKHQKFSASRINREYRKKDLNQAHLAILSPAPSILEEERYPFGVLSVVLGDSVGSKLYWEIVDKGLAESADTDLDERDDTGTFITFVSVEPQNLDKVREIVHRVLTNSADIGNEEIERAKTKLMTRIALSGESTLGRMRALGHEWVSRKQIHVLETYVKKIQAITKNDIIAALDKYSLSNWSEFVLLPD